MKTSEFDFIVPPELIAHEPATKRDESRLMVLGRKTESIEHKHFYNIIDYLNPGDLLVLNNTKVIPANLAGRREGGGGKVEVLLVKQLLKPETKSLGFNNRKQTRNRDFQSQVPNTIVWECLVKPGKKLNVGSKIIFGEGEVVGEVLEKTGTGEQIIAFTGDLDGYINSKGQIPLPPYIHSSFVIRNSSLTNRYQTVYAEKEGASAAPTAGLHFTPELIAKINAKGVNIAYVTLHTGLATFKPVYAENIEDHKMYYESYEVPAETIEA
ncbi:MAG: S-adenosylmethionine:tRNA ribosyltransferase-isomerase, partial [bacterium]